MMLSCNSASEHRNQNTWSQLQSPTIYNMQNCRQRCPYIKCRTLFWLYPSQITYLVAAWLCVSCVSTQRQRQRHSVLASRHSVLAQRRFVTGCCCGCHQRCFSKPTPSILTHIVRNQFVLFKKICFVFAMFIQAFAPLLECELLRLSPIIFVKSDSAFFIIFWQILHSGISSFH